MSKFSLHIGLGTTRRETIGFVPCPHVPRPASKTRSLILNSNLYDCKDKFNVHHHLFSSKNLSKTKKFVYLCSRKTKQRMSYINLCNYLCL